MSGPTSPELQFHPAGRVAGVKDSFVLTPSIPRSDWSRRPAARSSMGASRPAALSRTGGSSGILHRHDAPGACPDLKSP